MRNLNLWRLIGLLTLMPVGFVLALILDNSLIENFVVFQAFSALSIGLSVFLCYFAFREKLPLWPIWIVGLLLAGPFICPFAWWQLFRRLEAPL